MPSLSHVIVVVLVFIGTSSGITYKTEVIVSVFVIVLSVYEVTTL
jgi:hypothetical protein